MTEVSATPGQDVPLIPVRMLNEYVYCPRLAYLMWVQGEFEHNAYTVEGLIRHRRVDKPKGKLPEQPAHPEEELRLRGRDDLLRGVARAGPGKRLGYVPRVPVTAEQFADAAVRAGWIREKGMRVVAPGVTMRFVDARRLIAMKEQAGRPKDLDDIEHLRRLLQDDERR